MPAARALLRAPFALLRTTWRFASGLVLVVAIAAGVFAAMLLAVRFIVFPNIGHYRDTITALISRQVQQPVELDVVATAWDGWNPKLVIEGFRIRSRAANAALLELPRVDLTVSWTSLPLLDLRLDTLVIERPRLSIRRGEDGLIHLAGIEIDPTREDSAVSDWLLRQPRIVVRNALITWNDDARKAPQLVLNDVHLVLERGFAQHRFGLRGNPPPEIAAPIDLRGELDRGSPHDLAHAEGRLYVRLDYADLSAWKEWLPLPRDIASGQGALRGWFTFAQGQPREITADVALAEVRMRVEPGLPELSLSRLEGRVGWRSSGRKHEFQARNLTLRTQSGARLEPANLELAFDGTEGGRGGRLVFDRLQLLPLRELAGELPLPAALRADLKAYAPTGGLSGGDIRWTGRADAPQTLELKADFRDLAFLPHENVPGATNLAGSVKATEAGGQLKLAARNSSLAFPRYFTHAIEVDHAQGEVTWTHRDSVTDVRIGRIDFSNADAAGHLGGTYRHTAAAGGTIDLDAALTRAVVAAVPRYLPTRVPPAARDWIARAIKGGTVNDAKLKLKGNPAAFPFADSKAGLFTVDVGGKGLVLDYADGWPAISDIDAGVHFRNTGLAIAASRAAVSGVALTNVTVSIPDLREPVLAVSGAAAGATRDFLRFVQASPLHKRTGEFVARAEAIGDGRLGLRLTLPLHDLPASTVAGEYTLAANQLKLEGVPALAQVNGTVAFTHRDARAQDITAQALGGPVRVAFTSDAGRLHVSASGASPVGAISREYPLPLADQATGTTDWTLALDTTDEASGWTVESSLRDVAIDLPAPLRKLAGEPLPLRIERRPLSRPMGDTIDVALGTAAHIAMRRSLQNGAFRTDNVLVSLGTASTQPEARRAERPGLWIRADVPAIDVDRWLKVQRAAEARTASAPAGADELLLNGLDLTAQTMTAFGRDFAGARVTGRRVRGDWRIDLATAEVEGHATWIPPAPALPNGRVVARLARFATPPGAARPDVADPAADQTSPGWPELDVTADTLRSGRNELGRLQLLAKPARGEWRIERLAIENDSGRMEARGAWRTGAKPEETRLEVTLDVQDAGSFLARFGHPGLLQGAATKIEGQLAWAGAPSDFDYPSLSGAFRLETASGRFTKVEPGIGKLLGVLSLQALPRRITLDFRDVFSEGFAFDRVTGNVRIAKGVMSTDDLHLRGTSAQVAIAGSVDLASETQRLQVKVQPTLSAGVSGGAALLFLANPAVAAVVGAGSLLAQKVLRDPIEQMFSYQYTITGRWSDPVVTRGPVATAAAAPDTSGGKP